MTTMTVQQAQAAQAQQMQAGHYAQYPNAAGPGNYNFGGIGGGWVSPQPLSFPNYTITQVGTTEPEDTSLELFEDLVGIIKQLEGKLNLDPKDKSKHAYLELIMGKIQEDVINDTIQKLKALDI